MMGVEKTPHCFDGFLCDKLTYIEDSFYGFTFLQNNLAPAGYWRDRSSETAFEKYKKESNFLAPLNNEI
jgi:hypothetical protein